MMKVALIALEAPSFEGAPLVGGSAKAPFKLFKALKKQPDLEVDFYHFVGHSNVSGTHRLFHLPGKLYLKTLFRELTLLCYAPLLFRYDIIQIHHPHFALILSALKRIFGFKSKIIVKAHGTALPELSANKYKGFKNAILKVNAFIHLKHDRMALKWSDICICSSRFQIQEMVDIYKLPRDKLNVIYNGYDVDYLEGKDVVKKPKTIVMCGRLVPKKNFEYALELFKCLEQKDEQYRLTLVCGSKEKIENRETYESILQKAGGNEKIKICFDLDENALANVMLESEIALIPSVGYESIPSVLYEFLAAKCRVFASFEWGIIEILDEKSALSHRVEEDAKKIYFTKLTDSKIDITGFSYTAIAMHYREFYE